MQAPEAKGTATTLALSSFKIFDIWPTVDFSHEFQNSKYCITILCILVTLQLAFSLHPPPDPANTPSKARSGWDELVP